jgi:protein SCO1/2
LRRGKSSSKKPERGGLAALLTALLCALPAAAGATGTHLHGVVLSVTPQSGEAVVRHDPFGGMPGMTMPFRIVPRSRAAELLPGNVIDATVDTASDPWTLHDVSVAATQAVTAPSAPRVAQLHVGDTVPDTPFVDQTGQPFRFSQLHGMNVVLAFVYTRCRDPQMCPLISSHFNLLQRDAAAHNLHLVEVTLDPSYDRPPVLARYGRLFGADPRTWTLAVGDAQATLDFAARFGVAVFPDPDAGLIHSENTVLIGPDGTIRTMIPDASWQPETILADLNPSPAAESAAAESAVLLLSLVAAAGYLALRFGRRVFARR